jgi:hypothetical protein
MAEHGYDVRSRDSRWLLDAVTTTAADMQTQFHAFRKAYG